MADIFAHAALIISPSDAVDCSGGCLRPRKYRSSGPVPIILEIPRYYKAREKESCNLLCILPHQANKEHGIMVSRKQGLVDSRA